MPTTTSPTDEPQNKAHEAPPPDEAHGQAQDQDQEHDGQEAQEVGPPLPESMRGGQLARCDVPADWRMMVEMARFLSSAGMWPSWFHNSPGNVMAIMLKARALDIPLDVAVHHIHVIDARTPDGKGGKVEPSAELVRALLEREGYGVNITEFSVRVCEIQITPPGRRTRTVRYTIADAVRAELLKRPTWMKYTPDMLLARCSRRAAKLWAPGVSTGLAMAGMAEELFEGDEPIPVVVSEEAREVMRRIEQNVEDDPVAEHQRLQALWKECGKDLLEEPADEMGVRVGDILTQLLKLAAQQIAEAAAQRKAATDDHPQNPRGAQGQTAPPAAPMAGDHDQGGEQDDAAPGPGFESGWRLDCGCDGDAVMREGHSCETAAPADTPPTQRPNGQPDPRPDDRPDDAVARPDPRQSTAARRTHERRPGDPAQPSRG